VLAFVRDASSVLRVLLDGSAKRSMAWNTGTRVAWSQWVDISWYEFT